MNDPGFSECPGHPDRTAKGMFFNGVLDAIAKQRKSSVVSAPAGREEDELA